MRGLILLCLLIPGFSLQAQTFQARINDTQWTLDTSALQCQLTQPIPDYGEARFEQDNAGELKLIFESQNYPADGDQIRFAVQAAPWHSTAQETELATLPVNTGQTRFVLGGRHARQALVALQAGEFPLLQYPSPILNTPVEARISTVHANRSLMVFTQCLGDLHPQSFTDIAQQRVYFDSESAKLSPDAQQKLDRLADYLKLDDEITAVKIRAHTDSFGRRKLNEPLSEKRARVVKAYLTEREVDESLLVTASLMDTEPAAPNDTAEGRAQNRRTAIIVQR